MDTKKEELAVVTDDQEITVTTDDLQTVTLNLAELPHIVSNQVKQIGDLSIKVKQAMASAGQAQKSAENAKEKSTGLGHKKAAIEALQEATVDIADAQISAAEAQELSFQYQQQLGEITKYLFALGVSNIAANRTVIQQLELYLKDASEEELNELAKKEICNVVKQLKAQEDIMEKQKAQGEVLKELSEDISTIKGKDLEQDQLLLEQAERSEELEQLLEENATKDEQQDRLIEEGEQKDSEQDRLIEEQAKKDEEHDRLIAEQAQKDEEHDRLIAEQAGKDEEHDQMLAQHTEDLHRQEDRIKVLEEEIDALKSELARKSGKTFTYFSTGIALLAVLLAALQYIL